MSLTPPVSPLSHDNSNRFERQNANHSDETFSSRPTFGVRIADIAALRADGSIVIGQRKIPTLPQFDSAFGAFAQGTLLQTEKGFVAIEDLQPGDTVTTANGTNEKVTWVGSTSFAPSDQGERMSLTRIMADSFGVNRPETFVSLGTAARLLQTPPHLRGMADANRMMTPAKEFVDGVNVIDVMPPTPVRMFHLAVQSNAPIIAGGLEVESYHPGPMPLQALSHTLRSVFLSVFPHIEQISDFGTMSYPRAPEDNSQSAA